MTGAETPASRTRLTFACMVIVVALMLLVPAILNGSPFIFLDSDQYFTVGQRIFEAVFSSAGEAAAAPQSGDAAARASATTPNGGGFLAAIAGGRSPVYSLALYLTSNFLSQWTLALIQAAVCALLIVRFCQLAWGRLDWTLVLTAAVLLSFLTGLGFHAAFMMPDVFAGCLVLALTIFLYFKPAGRIENILLLGGAFAMATLHTTNLLLVLSALIAVAIVSAIERKPLAPMLPRLAAVVAIAVASLAFNTVYAAGVRAVAGETVRSPPYLMARVIGDGTGEAFLAKHCDGQSKPFAACAYADIDFQNHDTFLWEPSSGGFQTADSEMRAALSAEELRFAAAVLAADPAAQLAASLQNFTRQLVTAPIDEIGYGVPFLATFPGWTDSAIMRVTPGAEACNTAGGCPQPAFGWVWSRIVGTVNMLVLPLFLIGSVILFANRKGLNIDLPDATVRVVQAAWFIALLVAANAAICGILSGVNGRYQTRLVWVLALAVITLSPLVLPYFQRVTAGGLLWPGTVRK
jgi:hypothetical protein